MKTYLRVLAVLYLLGGLIHIADILDLRLKFSEMNLTWQVWIVALAILDLLASVGLWRDKAWGKNLFLFIAFAQLVAYSGFANIFGDQNLLIAFHIVSLVIYQFLLLREKRAKIQER